MSWLTILGLTAGFCTTLAFLPQVIKTYRTRSTADISLGMFSVLVLGIALWVVYGALTGDLPLIDLRRNYPTIMASGTLTRRNDWIFQSSIFGPLFRWLLLPSIALLVGLTACKEEASGTGTTAAPVMSAFMSSIEALGLRLRPPESNVTPLPTRASVGESPPRVDRSTTNRGGCSEPAATPIMPPNRSCSIQAWPNRPASGVANASESSRDSPRGESMGSLVWLAPRNVASSRADWIRASRSAPSCK